MKQGRSGADGGKKPVKRYTRAYNPSTLESAGVVEHTDPAVYQEIFRRARSAQAAWARLSFGERRRRVEPVSRYIADHADELSETIHRATGKTRIDALATEVLPSAIAARWYAKNTGRALRPVRLKSSSIIFAQKRNMITREPYGVVGIISPWNYPFSIPFAEVIMGIMAGNAVLLKVATASVLVGKAVEGAMSAADVPEGLFHLVTGSGGEVSGAFFKNGVDKLFFTGSVGTGKQLMERAASSLTPLSLELGGKDPMIVLGDADLERASSGAAWAGYQNAGQSCGGVERVYVHESVYDTFVELLAAKTRALRHGVDRDFSVDMGSMTTGDQLRTVRRQVDEAKKKGARVVAESVSAGPAKGYFFPATLMTGVDHGMELMREETFGPVIPVMKFSTIEEALELANDSAMGLTSSIWTRDTALARTLAPLLKTGVTTINDHLYTHGQPETPWFGWRQSGIGYTHSGLGLLEMTRPKLINWDLLSPKRNVWWYPFSEDKYLGLKNTLRFLFPRSPREWAVSGIKTLLFAVAWMFTSWKTR